MRIPRRAPRSVARFGCSGRERDGPSATGDRIEIVVMASLSENARRRSSAGRRERETYLEGRTAGVGFTQLGGSAEHPGEASNEVEAEPQARSARAAAGGALMEHLEDRVPLLGHDAGPGVGD